MTAEEVVVARLLACPAVVALVGPRVYLDLLPQGPTYPCVRVTLVDDVGMYHLRGPEGAGRARVQVDAYAQTASGVDPYAEAVAVADAVTGDGKGPAASGLAGWTGAVGSPSVTLTGCYRVTRTRRYDPDELRVVTMSQDFIVWHHG